MAVAQKIVSLEDHKEKVMGKPQTEDGYIRIANELFDAILAFSFSGRQQKIISAVMRKTYGFNKTQDEIGLTQFVNMTGIEMKHVSTVIAELVEMNVLIVSNGTHARLIKINKNYQEWVSLKKGVSLKRVSLKEVKGSPYFGDKPLPNLGNTKDIPKDIPKDIGAAPKKQDTFFPADFKINETNIRIAGEQNVSAEDEVCRFEDFHKSKGSKFSNWNSAFNTWLRNAGKFKIKDNPTQAKTIGGMKVGKNWV
jgi:phage replication O-like protein O